MTGATPLISQDDEILSVIRAMHSRTEPNELPRIPLQEPMCLLLQVYSSADFNCPPLSRIGSRGLTYHPGSDARAEDDQSTPRASQPPRVAYRTVKGGGLDAARKARPASDPVSARKQDRG